MVHQALAFLTRIMPTASSTKHTWRLRAELRQVEAEAAAAKKQWERFTGFAVGVGHY
jgi:hypothetical protein